MRPSAARISFSRVAAEYRCGASRNIVRLQPDIVQPRSGWISFPMVPHSAIQRSLGNNMLTLCEMMKTCRVAAWVTSE